LPVDAIVGTVLEGKYRIDAIKGVGGMGEVYRATQINLDRTVAVKLMRGDFSADEQMAERFKREALAVGRLNHPNITTVYDYGIEPSLGAYLVMEFLTGRTLHEELKALGRIEPDRAVKIIKQACAAVNAAHVEGIIHRDLKPDNIFLLDESEDEPRIKILDFGIAKFYGEGDTEGLTLTAAGTVIGTPIYMSPEQCRGENLDPKSDVYSLGCVLFEMLTGRPPFTGPNISALIVQHATEAPPPPSMLLPGLPYQFEEVLLRALAKPREERYQTAAEFGDAIVQAWESCGLDFVRLPTLDLPLEAAAQLLGNAAPSSASSAASGEYRDSKSIPSDGRLRIAALPFNNLVRREEIEFLGLTLADGITNMLTDLGTLVVRPSAAVAQFEDAASDPRQVGADLAVDYLVCGTFLKDGDAFQATAQLVNVERNEVVWQQRITTTFTNVIALQDEVARQVVSGVAGCISELQQESA